MSRYSADPYQDRDIREARTAGIHAAALSQADGRSLDEYGFACRVAAGVSQAAETTAPAGTGETPHARGLVDPAIAAKAARKRRLAHARLLAQVKIEAAARVAEERRRAMEEFEIPPAWQLMTLVELHPELLGMFERVGNF